MIHAIDTIFDGRKFRSRLEARYAVLFKELGLEYQYEAEGHALSGEMYLPDFKLLQIPLWVEVKGQIPSERERAIMRVLSIETGVRSTIVGPLESLFNRDELLHQAVFPEGMSDSPYYFCECEWCGKIGFHWDGYGSRITCCARNEKSGDYVSNKSIRLIQAHEKAMQARFEHGEKG